MIKCKTCGAEIAKSAKRCPNCGAKVKKPWKWLILIGVIALIIAVSALSKPTVPEKTEFTVGETATFRDVSITLVSVDYHNGDEWNRPQDGKMFMVCEFEVSNDSDRDVVVSTWGDFNAYCDGYSMNDDLFATRTGENTLDGQLTKGTKIHGYIGYQVPTNFSEAKIEWLEFGKDYKMTFTINH